MKTNFQLHFDFEFDPMFLDLHLCNLKFESTLNSHHQGYKAFLNQLNQMLNIEYIIFLILEELVKGKAQAMWSNTILIFYVHE